MPWDSFPFHPCAAAHVGFFQFGMLISRVWFWREAPACPLFPFQQSVLNGIDPMPLVSSRSHTLLNREGVSYFPHKINGSARQEVVVGPVPTRKSSRMILVMVPGSAWSVASEMQSCLEIIYPELCSCICLGSCGEMQAVFSSLA